MKLSVTQHNILYIATWIASPILGLLIGINVHRIFEHFELRDRIWKTISYSTWQLRPPPKPWAEEGPCDVLIAEERECNKFKAVLGSFNESFRDLNGFDWAVDAVEDESGNHSVQFVVEGLSERSGHELCDWVARRGLEHCKVNCPDNSVEL